MATAADPAQALSDTYQSISAALQTMTARQIRTSVAISDGATDDDLGRPPCTGNRPRAPDGNAETDIAEVESFEDQRPLCKQPRIAGTQHPHHAG